MPRAPTKSKIWNGASLDTESRSFSAEAISRPRKLRGSFLQAKPQTSPANNPDAFGLYAKFSPLKDSWLTSSVPINIPKYAMHGKDSRIKHSTAVNVPQIDHKTFVNYGEEDSYQPLRITFATNHLLNYRNRPRTSTGKKRSELVTLSTISRIEALTGDVLPAVSEIWAGALSVFSTVDNMFPFSVGGPKQVTCGNADIPQNHLTHGVPNTDILIYVTVDGPHCSGKTSTQEIVSGATICSFDQHMRPISANLHVCLSNINISFREVPEEEILRLTSTLTIEVGKVLGLSSTLFHHFRNPVTGQPYGSSEKTVTCVNGTEALSLVPNVLQSSFDLGDESFGDGPFFQVITPTVRQVVRNHFDCQTLLGARLSQAETSSCFGDSFDPRYHFDEDFTLLGGSADAAFSLSPLTLVSGIFVLFLNLPLLLTFCFRHCWKIPAGIVPTSRSPQLPCLAEELAVDLWKAPALAGPKTPCLIIAEDFFAAMSRKKSKIYSSVDNRQVVISLTITRQTAQV